MKVLIIQQKMIGDVLTCSILCELIKKKHPNYEVHYLINTNTKPVVEHNPFIDKVVLFKNEYRDSKLALFNFLKSIRAEKYDIVIDAYSKLESNLITLFSWANQKISFKKYYSKFIYSEPITPKNNAESNLGLAIERRQQLLKPLGFQTDFTIFPKLYVTPEETKNAITLLKSHQIDLSKKTVMVSIIGSSENKTYPLNYMSKIVDYIAETQDCNILFNYIPNQLHDAKIIYEGCATKTKQGIYFDVLGKNLREFIALVNQCDFIIGNDGGAINMAKALNKPSYIIFSPWIEKKIWATFEDGVYHKSIHLKDVKPELFTHKTESDLKKNSISLYQHFSPEFIKDDLVDYITQLNTLKLSNYSLKQSVKINTPTKLSALVITYNEDKNIDSLIDNLSFTDEIIIVDSYSTDNTVAKIKQHKHVKLIQNKFVNFSNQRNFALKYANHDWVLFIDADERISEKLKDEINTTINNVQDDTVAFEVYRQFFYKKKLVRFSGWQTDKVFRLFKKDNVEYKKELFVHELLDINGKTGTLTEKLEHYSFDSYSDYKDKMIHYAALRAKELYIQKLKPTLFHFCLKPLYRFINHYVIRCGFLDGKKGITVAYLSAYYVYRRYVELKKLYKK
ncbi:MAG: glycosyltransferase [Flavobacteriaceae bacterium]